MSKQHYHAPWLHPIQIAGIIKRATSHQLQKETADELGIKPQYLCDILKGRRGLSPQVACRLHQFGLDGLELLLAQTVHSYFCASQHDSNGDQKGKEAMGDPGCAKREGEC